MQLARTAPASSHPHVRRRPPGHIGQEAHAGHHLRLSLLTAVPHPADTTAERPGEQRCQCPASVHQRLRRSAATAADRRSPGSPDRLRRRRRAAEDPRSHPRLFSGRCGQRSHVAGGELAYSPAPGADHGVASDGRAPASKASQRRRDTFAQSPRFDEQFECPVTVAKPRSGHARAASRGDLSAVRADSVRPMALRTACRWGVTRCPETLNNVSGPTGRSSALSPLLACERPV